MTDSESITLETEINSEDAANDIGNERVAEAVAYAHIERDRLPSFAAMESVLRE